MTTLAELDGFESDFHETPEHDGALARFFAAREAFFPASPGLEEQVMAAISAEEEAGTETVSFRAWVLTGLFVLVSLATVYFGVDFSTVARAAGSAFLVPLGLVSGGVITICGLLFIGSHMEQLQAMLGLDTKRA